MDTYLSFRASEGEVGFLVTIIRIEIFNFILTYIKQGGVFIFIPDFIKSA